MTDWTPEDAVQAAMDVFRAEDERQTKLHELLETIREQIRTEVAPEHRPQGLFKNIQDAVYAMRGRTPILNDARVSAVLARLRKPVTEGEVKGVVRSLSLIACAPRCEHASECNCTVLDNAADLIQRLAGQMAEAQSRFEREHAAILSRLGGSND